MLCACYKAQNYPFYGVVINYCLSDIPGIHYIAKLMRTVVCQRVHGTHHTKTDMRTGP